MKSLLAILISSALVVSGYSQTRNVLVNTNNVVVQPTNFWSVDATNARTGLGLGTAATNPASAFQPSSGVLSNLASSNAVNLTNLRATNIVGVIPASNISSLSLTNISGTLAISNGGSGATTAGEARTNFGIGSSWLTNTVASNFRTAIGATVVGDSIFTATDAATARTNLGLGSTNVITNRTLVLPQADGLSSSTAYGIQWRSIYPAGNGLIALSGTDDQGETTFRISTGTMSGTTAEVALFNASQITFYKPLDFNNTTNEATTRTNLGLGWAALTNTSASGFGAALYGSNTNPVLVNTNGEVVSPTNFWQAAPINTVLQNITNVVGNATNAATNARMLFLYSLAPTVTNVTSTITLPTNGSTFGGDVATITHLGPTSSVTAIRALGAGTNIITLNQPEESVRLIYRDSGWTLMDNISYIEPIFFSGTNAAANAAASRTNLGLGATNDVQFNTVNARGIFDGTNEIIDIENNWLNYVGFGATFEWNDTANTTYVPFAFGGTNSALNAAITRTNLGLPLAALTNTSVTNFQKAIFYTNTAPSNIGGNLGTIAAWIEIVASNGVTYKIPAYTNVP